MNKKFKRIAASVMAAMTLAVGTVCMTSTSASAAKASDSYSSFTWSRNGTYGSVSLKNNSGASRYAQVNIYGYNTAGKYVDHLGKSRVIAQGKELPESGTINYAASMTFGGYLYCATKPVGGYLGTPWSKSA